MILSFSSSGCSDWPYTLHGAEKLLYFISRCDALCNHNQCFILFFFLPCPLTISWGTLACLLAGAQRHFMISGKIVYVYTCSHFLWCSIVYKARLCLPVCLWPDAPPAFSVLGPKCADGSKAETSCGASVKTSPPLPCTGWRGWTTTPLCIASRLNGKGHGWLSFPLVTHYNEHLAGLPGFCDCLLIHSYSNCQIFIFTRCSPSFSSGGAVLGEDCHWGWFLLFTIPVQ